jgi:pyridoxamine 5'-phosphate oxidase
MDIADQRRIFETRGLDVADVDADPFVQFERWYAAARDAGIHQPDAMALATVDADGQPSVRHVLLKGFDADGFTFFTNYESAKGHELAVNPRASVVFPWLALNRQVRVTGPVDRVAAAESDEYFATRPRGSQLSAWASSQSEVIASRAELEEQADVAARRFAEREVERPPYWGGYRLAPVAIELWQGRADRLHDRLVYRRTDGAWLIQRLQP